LLGRCSGPGARSTGLRALDDRIEIGAGAERAEGDAQKAPATAAGAVCASSDACTANATSCARRRASVSEAIASMRAGSASARRSSAAYWPRAGASSFVSAAIASPLRRPRSRSSAMMLPAPSQMELSGISR
jgi:hypothetical protein